MAVQWTAGLQAASVTTTIFLLGQPLSNPGGQSIGMNIKRLFSMVDGNETVVATFGHARLIRHSNGRHELVGGSRAEHSAAREWCSLFGHELVFSSRIGSESSEIAFAG